MPFALVTIGLIMIVSGSRDTYAALGRELVADFTGPGNFTYWLVALGAVGSLGYIPALRGFSRGFMALILISMVLKNGGVFDQFTSALNLGPVRPANDNVNAATTTQQSGNGGSSLALGFNSGDAKGNFLKAADFLKMFL